MPKPRRPRDPFEQLIDEALEFDRYIPYDEAWGFTSELASVADRIDKLRAAEPGRAAALYEMLLAGLSDKAEDIDDSDGEMGELAGDLIGRWIRARRAATADPDETARNLLAWEEDDPYGMYNDCGCQAVEAFDKAGLAAYEKQVRARFERSRMKLGGDVLRVIYTAQRDIDAYMDLCERTGFEPEDCEAIA